VHIAAVLAGHLFLFYQYTGCTVGSVSTPTPRAVPGRCSGRRTLLLWASAVIFIRDPNVVAVVCNDKYTFAGSRGHTPHK
jgi:hypothetical protein